MVPINANFSKPEVAAGFLPKASAYKARAGSHHFGI
jgi:hypothetical protein